MGSEKNSHRNFGLDVARAFAISLVVLSHFHEGSHALGIYGVELFFALSGFLIGGILYRVMPENDHFSGSALLQFWQRRWWRTLPNYFLFLVLICGFHLVFPRQGEIPSLVPFFFFAQQMVSAENSFFGVSWSLCIEEWFYLCFPLLLVGTSRLVPNRAIAFSASLLLLFLLMPILRLWVAAGTTHPEAVRLLTIPRLDAIGFGVAVAFLLAQFRPGEATLRKLALGGTVLVGATVMLDFLSPSDSGFYLVASTALPAGFALLLPTLSRLPYPSRWDFLGGSITAVSLWSYSIYLCHLPIHLALVELFGDWRDNVLINLGSKVLGLGLTLGFSWFVYRFFETPCLRFRPAETAGSPPAGSGKERRTSFARRRNTARSVPSSEP